MTDLPTSASATGDFGSLFSGIGGIDLGLERAGWRCAWQSEIDPYASAVLARHWPDVPNLGDVTQIEWSQVEPVDIICGGYPCQPFSYAGRGDGWLPEPPLDRVAYGLPLRVVRDPLHALGNAVVPHVAEWIGRHIAEVAA